VAFWKITNSAVVEVHNVDSLLAAWKFYGPDSGVGRFVITEPLTTRQFRTLPSALRSRLDYAQAKAA
jgi:hypothetical protein